MTKTKFSSFMLIAVFATFLFGCNEFQKSYLLAKDETPQWVVQQVMDSYDVELLDDVYKTEISSDEQGNRVYVYTVVFKKYDSDSLIAVDIRDNGFMLPSRRIERTGDTVPSTDH